MIIFINNLFEQRYYCNFAKNTAVLSKRKRFCFILVKEMFAYDSEMA